MADMVSSLLSFASWPFPLRPSLENLVDPEARRAGRDRTHAIGLRGILLLTIGGVVRRMRLVAFLAALPLFFIQGPSLALLLVDATPTSYRPSPTGFTAASIAEGGCARVPAANCVGCHGRSGDGVGGVGQAADLQWLPHIWSHPAGDFVPLVPLARDRGAGRHARDAFAFETILTERARWSAVDYVACTEHRRGHTRLERMARSRAGSGHFADMHDHRGPWPC